MESWSGAILIAWGVWVRADSDALSSLPSYDPISAFIPDGVWSYLALLTGAALVVARLIGGDWPRIAAGFVAMVLFKVLAVSIMVSPTPGPNAMVLCGLALANMAVVIRLFIHAVRPHR